jgi:hypothetical protein
VVVTFLDEKKKDATWKYSIIIASPPDVAGIPGRQKFDAADAKALARYAAIMRNGSCFSPDLAQPRHPANTDQDGLLTITDKKLLNRAKNVLARVGALEQLKGIAANAAYFADALDKVLRKTKN